MKTESQGTAVVLWVLLGLFCLRVLGQILVAFFHVTFLPPMEAWYSGIISYPYLLPAQILIVVLLTKICLDFSRGKGVFVQPHPAWSRGALYFGILYLATMFLRYILHMALNPEERWFGGTIPIAFHCVLASYVILFGWFHRRTQRTRRDFVSKNVVLK